MAGLPLRQIRLQATVGGTAGWQQSANGVLCGIVLKQDIAAMLSNSEFSSLVTLDYSTTGDANDAFTMAFSWESVAGDIVGLMPDGP